jgi:hypothetical protein
MYTKTSPPNSITGYAGCSTFMRSQTPSASAGISTTRPAGE